jgi:hypothetical protein
LAQPTGGNLFVGLWDEEMLTLIGVASIRFG